MKTSCEVSSESRFLFIVKKHEYQNWPISRDDRFRNYIGTCYQIHYVFIWYPAKSTYRLWKINQLRTEKIHYPPLISLLCTCTCLMSAHSPEVAAATIMADTNDDLAVFLPRLQLRFSQLLHSPFRSVTSGGNASITNSTVVMSALIPFAYIYTYVCVFVNFMGSWNHSCAINFVN